MNKFLLAHTVVQFSVLSECKDFAALGTNFGFLYVISLRNLVDSPNSRLSFLLHLTVPCRSSVLSLLTKNDYIWIGVSGCVIAISWSDIKSKKIEMKTIQFPLIQSAFELPSVTNILNLIK